MDWAFREGFLEEVTVKRALNSDQGFVQQRGWQRSFQKKSQGWERT